MISNNNSSSEPNIYYEYRTSDTHYLPQRIGAGALPNTKIKVCEVCTHNGYPHETIVARATKIVNYNDGSEHIHRQILDDPDIWTALWSLTQ